MCYDEFHMSMGFSRQSSGVKSNSARNGYKLEHRTAMAAREKGGRVVFIGNIPYGAHVPVACFKPDLEPSLTREQTSVKNRSGFGFLEYTDVDAAASAVRNLNDHQINGRTLRVDYSNDNGGGASNKPQGDEGHRAVPPGFLNMAAPPGGPDPSALPPLPPGTDVPPGLSAPDAISQTLQTLPAPQLLDIISQLKNLASTSPQQATALLTQAPQLGYAIFQALLLLGLVDTSIITTLVQQTPQPPPQAVPPPQPIAYQPAPSVQQPYGAPPQQYQPPPQQFQHAPMPQAYAPTPPLQQPAYQAPPPAPAAASSQDELIKQVLSMTRDQVFALDENSRNQIIQLRATLGAPVM
nr:isoform 2 of cleavage stimulation factor subunit 2 [Quercus suber]